MGRLLDCARDGFLAVRVMDGGAINAPLEVAEAALASR